MYYAGEEAIGQNPIPDGIEVSENDYRLLLAGMMQGKKVMIVEGAAVLVDPPAPVDPVDLDPVDEPEPTLENALLAYAVDKRWQIEVSGLQFEASEGVFVGIPTTDRAKTLITSAARITADEETIKFKSYDLGYVTVTGAQIRQAELAIAARIQALFAAESDIVDAIMAGTITTKAEIDAALEAV